MAIREPSDSRHLRICSEERPRTEGDRYVRRQKQEAGFTRRGRHHRRLRLDLPEGSRMKPALTERPRDTLRHSESEPNGARLARRRTHKPTWPTNGSRPRSRGPIPTTICPGRNSSSSPTAKASRSRRVAERTEPPSLT